MLTKDNVLEALETSVSADGLTLNVYYPFVGEQGELLESKGSYTYDSVELLQENTAKVVDVFAAQVVEQFAKVEELEGGHTRTKFKRFMGLKFMTVAIDHLFNADDDRSYVKVGSLELVHYAKRAGASFGFEWKPAPGFALAFGTAASSGKGKTRGVMVSR